MSADKGPQVVEVDAVLPPDEAVGGGLRNVPAASTASSQTGIPESRTSGLIAYFLDDAIRIPGSKFRIGLDPIIGFLFPGLGDAVTATVGSTILGDALRKGVPVCVVLRMGVNVFVNATVGTVPFAGALFSAWFKSNAQNYSLLLKYTEDPDHRVVRRSKWPIIVLLGANVVFIVAIWGGLFLLVRYLMALSGIELPGR